MDLKVTCTQEVADQISARNDENSRALVAIMQTYLMGFHKDAVTYGAGVRFMNSRSQGRLPSVIETEDYGTVCFRWRKEGVLLGRQLVVGWIFFGTLQEAAAEGLI